MGSKAARGLLVILLLGVAVVGCGSSKRTLAKADFIKRADAICAASNKQANAIPFPNVNPAKASTAQLPQIATALNRLVAVQRDEAAKLKALPDPDRDAALFHSAFGGFQRQIAALANAAQAASSGNVNAFHNAAKGITSTTVGAQSRANAKKFGLKVCGQGGGNG